MPFCSKGLVLVCRRPKVHSHSPVSMHIFNLSIRNGNGNIKKKQPFFAWLRWKSWHIEQNAIQAYGNIFRVYLDVAVPVSASSSVDKAFMPRCHSPLQVSTPTESLKTKKSGDIGCVHNCIKSRQGPLLYVTPLFITVSVDKDITVVIASIQYIIKYIFYFIIIVDRKTDVIHLSFS